MEARTKPMITTSRFDLIENATARTRWIHGRTAARSASGSSVPTLNVDSSMVNSTYVRPDTFDVICNDGQCDVSL